MGHERVDEDAERVTDAVDEKVAYERGCTHHPTIAACANTWKMKGVEGECKYLLCATQAGSKIGEIIVEKWFFR